MAALRYRTYDASLIAMLGGILIEVELGSATQSIFGMIRMLQNKDIDGFVLDRYTLVLFSTHHSKHLHGVSEVMKEGVEYLLHKYVHTDMTYAAEKLSYGILVKNIED